MELEIKEKTMSKNAFDADVRRLKYASDCYEYVLKESDKYEYRIIKLLR